MQAAEMMRLAVAPRLDLEAARAWAEDFREEMRRRRSVRDFAPDPVPPGVIEACLRTAGSAPSGANQQPWHFAVITSPAAKRRIRIEAEREEYAFYNGRAPEDWLDALAPLGTNASKPFLEIAPVLIPIFAQRHGIAPDGGKVKHYYVPESVGIATGFLVAALHHAGLATLTHTPSPMGFLNEICGRPEHEKPMCYWWWATPPRAARCRWRAASRRSWPRSPAGSEDDKDRVMAGELWQLDATDLARLIRLGKASAREAVLSCLARMDAVNGRLNAVVRRMDAEALAAADAADAARARGEALGPLHGVPVTTKVNTDQRGHPTDNGVVAFKDMIAQEDAPVVANLRAAGAIFIGRTNAPAFSMRAMSDNALHGRTFNPRDKAISRAGRAAGPVRRWPPASARSPMATTSAARCASRPIATAWSGCGWGWDGFRRSIPP